MCSKQSWRYGLLALNLLDEHASSALILFSYSRTTFGPVQKAIERNPDPEGDAQGRFHFPLLAPTLHWLDAVPVRFLRLLLPQSTSS
jgi:hypothetical protein